MRLRGVSRSAALVAAGAFAAMMARGSKAAADDGPSPTHAAIGDDLEAYYRGELVAAYVIGAVGLAGVAGGRYLVTRSGDFARGLGWAWLAMGSLEAIGAGFYALQVGGETDRYQAAFARDPAAYRAAEIDHLRGTEARFPYYRAVELVLTLGGAAMAGYGLLTNRDVWKGTGIGVASLALPILVIDGFNDARAKRYLVNVQSFQAGVQPVGAGGPGGARGTGAQLSLGGTF